MALGYIVCDLTLDLSEIDWGERYLNYMIENESAVTTEYYDTLKKSKNAPLPTHPLEAYAGTYENGGYGTLDIFVEGDKLYTTLCKQRSLIIPAGYDNFLCDFERQRLLIPMKFEYDKTGEINKLYAKMDKIAQMIEFTKMNPAIIK
jgi:hypothetical protein